MEAKKLGIVVGLASAIVLGACAHREDRWSAKVVSDDSVNINVAMREGLAAWKERHFERELRQALDRFEAVASQNPYHVEAHALLARGYYLLAVAHLKEPQDQIDALEKGLIWGRRLIQAFHPKSDPFSEETIAKMSKRTIDVLYWTAQDLYRYSLRVGLSGELRYRPAVRELMSRVEQLDPGYFHGAIFRFWGEVYANENVIAGGSMERSLESLRKSLVLEQKYLGSHLALAEIYAKHTHDQDLYKKELEFILKSDPHALSGLYPEQVIVQRRAKKLLSALN